MLRNIGRTVPYFHDGSVKSINEAVRITASVQLEMHLSEADTAAILAFLISRTGEVPANYKHL